VKIVHKQGVADGGSSDFRDAKVNEENAVIECRGYVRDLPLVNRLDAA
jgi:hypothetical protein